MIAAARPPFISAVPRPQTRPSRTTPSNGSRVQSRPGFDDVDVAVEVDARAGPGAGATGDDVDARMIVVVAGGRRGRGRNRR